MLDLVAVREGGTVADALQIALRTAQHAEKLGFARYWLAEHHNMAGIASSATAVLVGHIAGGTSRIRVGSGGVMLPNHAPLVVAEAFGTLAELYPGRIDLGLGRAPGTDPMTMRALRRDRIGFVFQAPYLIPFLDVIDNVALLPMLAGARNAEARARALELLTALDVQHRARAMPAQLSGGEQQRVAIARGLVNRPPVILADEPTAPLDSERALAVIRLLNDMAQRFQTAVIVVTHDEKIIPTFKRIYHIRDGVTFEEAGEGRAFG